MSPIALLFITLALCLVMGVPVSFSIGISCMVFLLSNGYPPLGILVQRMVGGAQSFTMMSLPMFVFAGALMAYGSTPRLMRLANMLLGRMPGGLGAVHQPYIEGDLRVFRPKGLKEPGEEVLAGDRGGRHGDGAPDLPGEGSQLLQCPVPEGQNLPGIAAEQLSGLRGDRCRPLEELDLQLLLQGRYPGADGGLGQVQQLRRPGEAVMLRHTDEGLQLL